MKGITMYKVYKLNSLIPPFKKEFIRSFNSFAEAQKYVESMGSVGFMIDY